MKIEYAEIGNLIREFRKKNRMSQEQLAELLNMEQYQISCLERAKSGSGIDSISRLLNTFKALNVPVTLSVGGKDIVMKESKSQTSDFAYDEEEREIDAFWNNVKRETQLIEKTSEYLLDEKKKKRFLSILKLFEMDETLDHSGYFSVTRPYSSIGFPVITIHEPPYSKQFEILKNLCEEYPNGAIYEAIAPQLPALEKLAEEESEEYGNDESYVGPELFNFYDILTMADLLFEQDFDYSNYYLFDIPLVTENEIILDFCSKKPKRTSNYGAFEITYDSLAKKPIITATLWDIEKGSVVTPVSSVPEAVQRDIFNEIEYDDEIAKTVNLAKEKKLLSPFPQKLDASDLREIKAIIAEQGLEIALSDEE